jgi:hypothetical protein
MTPSECRIAPSRWRPKGLTLAAPFAGLHKQLRTGEQCIVEGDSKVILVSGTLLNPAEWKRH